MVAMRVIFLGTPEFAIPSLNALSGSNYEICAVFTQPDKPAGRGQKTRMSPVKAWAEGRGIQVYQPERIRNEENRSIFSEINPDFIVVVAYGQILPAWLLRSACIAPVNVHGSLLPSYRGAAPVNWAILNGDLETGVTTMIVEEELDAGPILLTRTISVPETMTAGELAEKVASEGAAILIPTLDGLSKRTLMPEPQDKARVSWAPRITKEMSKIDWHRSAIEIHNRIRGLNPWPIAISEFNGQQLQIYRSLPEQESKSSGHEPGTCLGWTRCGIRIQCGGASVLEVLEVQLPGKARISGREFANGARLVQGTKIFCR